MIPMFKRTIGATLLAVCAAAPLAAQGGRMGDPTNKVEGSGQLPPGWMVRFDPPNRFNANAPAPTLKDISFVTMGNGYHVTSGPAAIYYNTKDMAKGVYAVSATFTQSKTNAHEAYGIFIAGKNLQDSTQNYLYLVVKPGDGSLAIGHRDSNGRPMYFIASRDGANPAVNKDGPDGSATNTLMIHVAPDSVHFLVNGKLVKGIAKSELGGASTDGQAGLRINHNISVHIDGWSVKQ
jgi:hypothetical protein